VENDGPENMGPILLHELHWDKCFSLSQWIICHSCSYFHCCIINWSL